VNTAEGLAIVGSGDGFVVVDKPPGMLSVPGKGPEKADCVAARVRAMFPAASGPLIVHRLDMETSGLIVLGLTPDAQRDLSAQFERREVEKAYTAVLEGSVPRDGGVIDLPLRLDVTNRPYQIVDLDRGREAVTRYRVVAREPDRTRVEFSPRTGRTHQLRVHAATPRERCGLGCPIVGDVLYGRGKPGDRLMLHASRLAFRLPGDGARVEFFSPPPF
jgi:tRNA pseudouridine32 synthase/23S rRNA pseudouridine746 synthase